MHRFQRAVPIGLLALTLLLPTAASAAQTDPAATAGTGTIVGSVACGSNEDSPVANALVSVDGHPAISTDSDAGGRFVLLGVPTLPGLTIDAVGGGTGDPTARAIRVDVSVHPGETLDIGPLDLAVCPPLQQVETVSSDVVQDDNTDRSGDQQ